MNPNELKAVLSKTNEVAIVPRHIEADLPWMATHRNRQGQIVCPTGLTRAKVIVDGQKWVEKRPVSACGDTDYEINRRNGVLVEYEIDIHDEDGNLVVVSGDPHPDFEGMSYMHWVKDPKKPNKQFPRDCKGKIPHTAISIKPSGKATVRKIISRKAILAAWPEYAMQEAKRAKEAQEAQEKRDRVNEALNRIMGRDVSTTQLNKWGDDIDGQICQAGYDTFYEYDEDGDYKRKKKPGQSGKGDRISEERGYIRIPVERAEEIIEKLGL